jgi:SAM-dependent methyltransferase
MAGMIRLRRRGTNSAGRLSSLGQDHDRAHREYVARLQPSHRIWLRTKPFSAPPTYELGRCLHSFAHIVDNLGLAPGAKVLDVGCGPGWLSEWLARCGYDVTGVDISKDMVAIAQARIAAIDGPIADGITATAQFHALPVHEIAWEERFDAAILYDAMHHFHDEEATLRAIRRALVPGGQIYIHEGVRPEPGSPGERELIAEMEEYGTLEAPFDPDYLVDVIERSGFINLRRLVEVDALFDTSNPRAAKAHVESAVRHPQTNTIIAMNPIAAELAGLPPFMAQIESQGPWSERSGGRELVRSLRITNAGRNIWSVGRSFPFPPGAVTVGCYVPTPSGRQELPRTLLPRALAPGESTEVELVLSPKDLEGTDEVVVDLVREGITWFCDAGSQALVLPLGSARKDASEV